MAITSYHRINVVGTDYKNKFAFSPVTLNLGAWENKQHFSTLHPFCCYSGYNAEAVYLSIFFNLSFLLLEVIF